MSTPIILLHGSLIADPWEGFDKLLEQKYKVYKPILPGFAGTATIPGRIHNTELFAEALGDFIKANGLFRAPLIAFSLGSVVAIKTAASGDHRGDLILVGMPVRFESPLMEQIISLPLPARHALAFNEIARGGLLWAILNDLIGPIDLKKASEYLQKLKETDVRAMVDTNPIEEIEKDLPWLLPQVKNRMRFVYGEYDKLKSGAENKIRRKLWLIKNAGHNVFADNPKQTLETINKLLSWWGRILL
jgi:pimeloyl-ACP methyl ester carboxylesterase